ncbi:hypothetical protein AMTR_s00073p00066340 [Amborella trichopoda]|uniref:Uncharacterized protein n=1 Tax=Amborella trichopoda TaxID=13333 RepID=W1NNJ9_AMBTC|nr:hypothetical protein AMTR_s00073p00066340 [Amborella trichopoda]
MGGREEIGGKESRGRWAGEVAGRGRRGCDFGEAEVEERWRRWQLYHHLVWVSEERDRGSKATGSRREKRPWAAAEWGYKGEEREGDKGGQQQRRRRLEWMAGC